MMKGKGSCSNSSKLRQRTLAEPSQHRRVSSMPTCVYDMLAAPLTMHSVRTLTKGERSTPATT